MRRYPRTLFSTATTLGAPLGVLAALCLLGACGGGPAETPTLSLEPGPQPEARVVVSGLGRGALNRLAKLEPEAAAWREVFVVQSAGSVESTLPALPGTYSVSEERAVFAPATPFLAGRSYRAVWRGRDGAAPPLELNFSIPQSTRPQARVVTLYPTGSELPENLRRLYVHFSQSMSQGQAARHLRLLSADGTRESIPLAGSAEELWNRARDRLTVLLEPGSAGDGQHGTALRAGQEYRLVIARGWLDAGGRPLGEDFERRFRVAPAARASIEPSAWRLRPPAAPDESLRVEFQQPLDHALLLRSLSVRDARGARVHGAAAVGAGELSWSFVPAAAWELGRYSLDVDGQLEDPAGNRVEGAGGSRSSRAVVRSLEFEVSTAGAGEPELR